MAESQRERENRQIHPRRRVIPVRRAEGFVHEVEELHGLEPGQLARTIESRLINMKEPSFEHMPEAIRKEIQGIEEELREDSPSAENVA